WENRLGCAAPPRLGRVQKADRQSHYRFSGRGDCGALFAIRAAGWRRIGPGNVLADHRGTAGPSGSRGLGDAGSGYRLTRDSSISRVLSLSINRPSLLTGTASL